MKVMRQINVYFLTFRAKKAPFLAKYILPDRGTLVKKFSFIAPNLRKQSQTLSTKLPPCEILPTAELIGERGDLLL